MNKPATLLTDNVLMTINVLEVARKLGVKKVVMTLSSGMYPPNSPNPLREEYIHDAPAHESNYSYAYAKRLVEPAIRAYRKQFGMNVIGLVPNGIFGPYDKFHPDEATFIGALMVRFLENSENDSPIVVWGDGSPLRELTYSEDMARAFLWCLFNYDSPQVLNVGTTEEHSIEDIARMIAQELDIDLSRIVFDGSKPNGVFRKSTDNSRFVGLSGFEYTPFRVGLRQTLGWLKRHYYEYSRATRAQ
jgi:GDP-L-fucose synthase